MSYVEEFCEEIALIDKGSIVLTGNLKQIKREYGKDRLRIRGEVNKSWEDEYIDKLNVSNNIVILRSLNAESMFNFLRSWTSSEWQVHIYLFLFITLSFHLKDPLLLPFQDTYPIPF